MGELFVNFNVFVFLSRFFFYLLLPPISEGAVLWDFVFVL